jgi:uncharacterized protein YheU (UPF0270 family)
MKNHHKGIIIPHDRLSQTALQGLIEEFVTRDGTDTGYTEGSLEKSIESDKRPILMTRQYASGSERAQHHRETWPICTSFHRLFSGHSTQFTQKCFHWQFHPPPAFRYGNYFCRIEQTRQVRSGKGEGRTEKSSERNQMVLNWILQIDNWLRQRR